MTELEEDDRQHRTRQPGLAQLAKLERTPPSLWNRQAAGLDGCDGDGDGGQDPGDRRAADRRANPDPAHEASGAQRADDCPQVVPGPLDSERPPVCLGRREG